MLQSESSAKRGERHEIQAAETAESGGNSGTWKLRKLRQLLALSSPSATGDFDGPVQLSSWKRMRRSRATEKKRPEGINQLMISTSHYVFSKGYWIHPLVGWPRLRMTMNDLDMSRQIDVGEQPSLIADVPWCFVVSSCAVLRKIVGLNYFYPLHLLLKSVPPFHVVKTPNTDLLTAHGLLHGLYTSRLWFVT